MGKLTGKVVVVTGGTRGLGLGIALEFAKAGANVVVASRSQRSVDQAVEKISLYNKNTCGMSMDVANLAQMEELANLAIARFEKIDVWVNNAGTSGPYGPTYGFEPQAFYQVIQTNIFGVYHGSRTALKYFIPQHAGKLINILGHGYNQPVPWQNAYGSSKSWICSFTKALAEEVKGSGVEVIAFNPGLVMTELLTDVECIAGSEERLKVFPSVVRLLAKPVEIPSQKIAQIASQESGSQNGKLINIFSPWLMVRSGLKEAWRIILRKPAPKLDINIKVIPPYEG